ncbi:MAG: NAD kinase [Bacteroidetes bacterium GWF2_33_16]|nr:MAG: NAD kinase [Bacteroidetes bacterium GWE2_32_14]OFY08844.1 MAG: NAD kinase [Bacteroidetes bacterium GWF2_33_16]
MKVAIYGRTVEKEFEKYVKEFLTVLKQHNIDFTIDKKFYEFLVREMQLNLKNTPLFETHEDIKDAVKMIFSIGGDGTILETVTLVKDANIPIVGINTGKLGFLANIAKDEIQTAIESIINNKYTIDERALLKVDSKSKIFSDFPYSLNEIAVQKKDSTMITIHVFINNEFLNTYWADGLIISTPTGSTAYSLSSGGPIILPHSGNFIITPICAHNLTVRPIVIPDSSIIKLKVESRSMNSLVSLDHRYVINDSSDEIIISKAEFKVKLLKLNSTDYYATLRNKLMWGIDKRN